MDNQIIKYQTPDGRASIEASLREETVWLSLNHLVLLFERDKSVLSRHIRNVFKEGELGREATVANFATVQTEGDREVVRDIEYYNLDVIISVGYRVKSQRGTNFRIWATGVLRRHLLENARLNTLENLGLLPNYTLTEDTVSFNASARGDGRPSIASCTSP